MNKRRASLVNRSCVRADRGEELGEKSAEKSIVETRLELLEAAHAEQGARLAGLEGVVFALQHRMQELEGALEPAVSAPAPHDALTPVPRPHVAARRR